MGLFSYKTIDGWKEIEGTIIKYGKGKNACNVIGIAKGSYYLTHIPSGLSLTQGYEFLSQAKQVANEIIKALEIEILNPMIKAEAFSQELRMYMEERWFGCKAPPTLEEWLNGPDYQRALEYSQPGGDLPIRETGEHPKELQAWDCTVAWIPCDKGGMPSEQLGCIIEGRPYDSKGIYPGDD